MPFSKGYTLGHITTKFTHSDIKVAPKMIERNKVKPLTTDKTHSAKSFRAQLEKQMIKICISPKSNEKFHKI